MDKLKVLFLDSEGEKEVSDVYDIKYENSGFKTDTMFLVYTNVNGFHFQDSKKCTVWEDEKDKGPLKKKNKPH